MLKFSALLLPVIAAECEKNVADYPGTCQEEAAYYGQTMDEFLSREDCNDFDALLNTDTCETGCCRIDDDFFRNGRKSPSRENRIWKPRGHGFKGILFGAKKTDANSTEGEPQWIALNAMLNTAKRNSNNSPEERRVFRKFVKEKLLGLMILYLAHDPAHTTDLPQPSFLKEQDSNGNYKVNNEAIRSKTWPTFSSFTDYGCWCFQRRTFQGYDSVPSFTAGSKGAFDPDLDAACRKRALSTKCATCDDYTNPCYEEQGYEFETVEDPETGRRLISCKNALGTCAYNNCVIDIRFAEEAAAAFRNMPTYDTRASQLMTGYVRGGIALTRQQKCLPVGQRPTNPPPAPPAPAAPASSNNEAASSNPFADAEATTDDGNSQGSIFFTDDSDELSLGSTADELLNLAEDLVTDIATAGDTDSDADTNRPRPAGGNNDQSSSQTSQSSSQSNQSSSQSSQSSSQSNQAPSQPVNPSQDADIDSQPATSDGEGSFLDDLLTSEDTFANAEAVTDSTVDEFVLTYTDDNNGDYMDDSSFGFADDHYDYSYDLDGSVTDDVSSSDYADLDTSYADIIDTVQEAPVAPPQQQEQQPQHQGPAASMYNNEHHHHNYITHDDLEDFDDDDDKICCGSHYPERYPIVERETNQCCGYTGAGYNPNNAVCCSTGIFHISEGFSEDQC